MDKETLKTLLLLGGMAGVAIVILTVTKTPQLYMPSCEDVQEL